MTRPNYHKMVQEIINFIVVTQGGGMRHQETISLNKLEKKVRAIMKEYHYPYTILPGERMMSHPTKPGYIIKWRPT